MLAAQRRSEIMTLLERDRIVRVSHLVNALGVSDMTIRRDLQALHEQGALEKVHGGAVVRAEPSTAEPGFEAKSARQLAQKESIAAHAAAMVRPGSAIAVSAGTTTFAFARHLLAIPGLTVVTNSVWVADLLHGARVPSHTVLLTGGVRTPSDALVGPLAIAALRSLHLDTVFMGVHGMDANAGFSTPNLLEAETNRAMIASARRMVVLADSTKWGVVGLSSMATLSTASALVTDTGLSQAARQALADDVDELVLVEPDEASRPWEDHGSPREADDLA
ncbi:DeoR/GlpR family DNA-binding transcription regulator [uncultured Nocardioides sp.]|uniref:Transcriptional regulator, DeoR family n=1 Tax=uncultured Nocardioides sp. TaxID=198441 RepID=A0A6J4P1V3_9ACTN|nr:DeoR/GlpR family DNA-binding transcription regulator [uncultured Nocardioides sp.]CAA9403833.1 MAG: Transcriptional regulator, DeoR family [uncultured Nocardioides sp.]